MKGQFGLRSNWQQRAIQLVYRITIGIIRHQAPIWWRQRIQIRNTREELVVNCRARVYGGMQPDNGFIQVADDFVWWIEQGRDQDNRQPDSQRNKTELPPRLQLRQPQAIRASDDGKASGQWSQKPPRDYDKLQWAKRSPIPS